MTDAITIQCASCGASNRVPREKLEQGLRAKCGRCKQPLPQVAAAPLVVRMPRSGRGRAAPLPVLVDAWAAWCGPCRMIAPAIGARAELAGKVRVVKLNVDENAATAGRFDIRSIPTLLVIAGGREVDRIVGAQPKETIRARLARFV